MPFPNTEAQFKKGQSGNPKGNQDRHSTRTVDEWVNKLLNDEEFEMQILEGYQLVDYKGAPIKAIIKSQLQLALQHTDPNVKSKSADLLLKYGATKKVQLGNDPENPLPQTKLIDGDELSQFMLLMKNNTKQ